MTVQTLHQPKSTVAQNSNNQSHSKSPVDLSQIQNFTLLYIPALACALKNLRIPHAGEAAIFLSQIAFWLGTDSGHSTRDGRKWIYNAYADWILQIPSLTENQFGVMVRSLVFHELIEKSCYASLCSQLTTHPVSWHQYNTSSWITLNVERIIELTNWYPFGKEEISTKTDQTPEPALGAEIANTTSGNCKSNFAKLGTQFPTIYIENSVSTKNGELTREKEQVYQLTEDPWIDQPEENNFFDGLKTKSSVKTQDSHQGQFSAAPRTIENTSATNTSHTTEDTSATNTSHTTNTTSATNTAQRNVSNNIEAPLPKLKSEEIDRPLYVWEDAFGYPNEYFLNWWAAKHYEPQGGKWETGARYFAFRQFYRDPAGADIIYQEYLQYFNTVANNAHQQQNQNIQAILPSCLVKYPEVNQENKEQVAKNVATVAARGAGVALPGNVAPCSTQHMSFEEANSGTSIKSLPNLENPALPGTGQQPAINLEELTKQVEFTNKRYHEYKGNRAERRRYQEIISWAKRTPGVVVTDSGISLEPTLLQQNLEQQLQAPQREVSSPPFLG
ncbi:MAG: hypothetical protein KME29_16255 [Calothrix sp. FI2-JRJ7]|jgi:hypothetical protein|nr:hypothetical protein [Calothrix sp. FI2-JRJ7]